MTEPLHGREGLIAASELPDEYEARWSSDWVKSTTWTAWPYSTLVRSDFRRIEKPREAMRSEARIDAIQMDQTVCAGTTNTAVARIVMMVPAAWRDKAALITIREILPNAPPEPDWNSEFERERAAHEETKRESVRREMAANDRYHEALERAESAAAKLGELSAAAGAMCDSFGDALGKLLESLRRCAPEGRADGDCGGGPAAYCSDHARKDRTMSDYGDCPHCGLTRCDPSPNERCAQCGHDMDGETLEQLACQVSERDEQIAGLKRQLAEVTAERDRANKKLIRAIAVLARYGGYDGAHHKMWCIDQTLRALTGDGYAASVAEIRDGEDGPETYDWDVGIPP